MEWIQYARKQGSPLSDTMLAVIGASRDVPIREMLTAPEKIAAQVPWQALIQARAMYRRFETLQNQCRAASEVVCPDFAERCLFASLERFLPAIRRIFSPLQLSSAHCETVLMLLEGCTKLALRSSTVRSSSCERSTERLSQYDELTGNMGLVSEIAPHRWAALRSGEGEGLLKVTFSFPRDQMLSQVALHAPFLPAGVRNIGETGLLDALVMGELPAWVRDQLDAHASRAAIEGAWKGFRNLLLADPVRSLPLAAIYIGNEKGKAGVVVLDGRGEVVEQWRTSADPSGVLRVARTIGDCKVAVVPERASADGLLQRLVTELAPNVSVVRIREAGLEPAARRLMRSHSFTREVASAVVLGRRAQSPMQEWGASDPLTLGLLQYQALVERAEFVATMRDVAGLAMSGFSDTREAGRAGPAFTREQQVISLTDLREGISLTGRVTNITDFGAFVHIGVGVEGLVHLSELADRYVKHPSEVVAMGQEVRVWVLKIELDRGRVSLTMRDPSLPRPRGTRTRISQARKDLDALFKK